MTAVLIVEDGPIKGRKIPLRGRKTLIGRGHDCDLQVLDEMLSRAHCLIEKKGESYSITDLNSRNGTLVDGQRIKTVELCPGDLISIGNRSLRFTEAKEIHVHDTTVNVVTKPGDGTEEIKSSIDPTRPALLSGFTERLNKEAVERRHRDLAAICNIGNLINSEHDLNRLCDLIVESILDVVKGDRGFLFLRDGAGDVKPVAVCGALEGDGVELTLSSTILNEAIEKGRAVLSSSAMLDDRFKESDSIIVHNITSAMCVPLNSKEEITGAIYVDTMGVSNPFTEADLELLSAIGKQAGLALERTGLIEDLENLFYDSVTSLVATIEASDPYTGGHSERVTALAVGIVCAMGQDEKMINRIRLAGLLHDIGKIGIPASVLNKKGSLTDDEWKIIKAHPEVGAGIISNIRRMEESVALAVRHHHERWNGAGYPDGLKGENIPLMSRILSVADAYDAMTSQRSYREFVFTEEQAMGELKDNVGGQFDGAVVDTFFTAFQKICVDK